MKSQRSTPSIRTPDRARVGTKLGEMSTRIAIPVPTSKDLAYNRRCWPAYAQAVQASGGEPVEIPLTLPTASLEALVATCQAVLLPGSPADVGPSTYGQAATEACSPADLNREATDRFLLEHAYRWRKPILGVCFGCQILNTFRGGTLLQDLATIPVNHPSARGVVVAHTAVIPRESLLARLIEPAEAEPDGAFLRLPVNSSHHQAIAIPGEGLMVSARCPQDAVVEAVEGSGEHLVLGVQWHPERTFAESPSSRSLFSHFVRTAAKWQPEER